jgi:hypothetical protein
MTITKTAIGNYLRKQTNGDVGMYRNGFKDGVEWAAHEAVITAGRAAIANAEPTGWQKIETAPKDKSVMLHCRGFIPFYCGRKRYGNLGEPQQSELAWRCDSSGRFANPTHWMPLPAAPKDTP